MDTPLGYSSKRRVVAIAIATYLRTRSLQEHPFFVFVFGSGYRGGIDRCRDIGVWVRIVLEGHRLGEKPHLQTSCFVSFSKFCTALTRVIFDFNLKFVGKSPLGMGFNANMWSLTTRYIFN